MATNLQGGRVQSLDILRGADLFFLGIAGPLLRCYDACSQGSLPPAVARQLTHVNWEGFTCWDLIMPLFLFMSGISMPYSMAKYQTPKRFYYRLMRRVVLLFLWGAVIQGNLLSLDPPQFHWFSNTLQAIAVGCFFTALLMRLKLPTAVLWGIVAALLGIFTALLMYGGDYSPTGNFCEKIERVVMGRWRDGVWYDEQGRWHFADHYHYTWIVSSLGFVATVLTGALAGRIIKNGTKKGRVILTLAAIGASMTLLGWAWAQPWFPTPMPIIKTIWTPSMVLFSSGLSFLLMALSYFLVDWLPGGRWLGWLKIFGMNSIAAYILFELTHEWFNEFFNHALYGLQPYTGAYYPLVLNTATCAFFTATLAYLYRHKIFFKV